MSCRNYNIILECTIQRSKHIKPEEKMKYNLCSIHTKTNGGHIRSVVQYITGEKPDDVEDGFDVPASTSPEYFILSRILLYVRMYFPRALIDPFAMGSIPENIILEWIRQWSDRDSKSANITILLRFVDEGILQQHLTTSTGLRCTSHHYWFASYEQLFHLQELIPSLFVSFAWKDKDNYDLHNLTTCLTQATSAQVIWCRSDISTDPLQCIRIEQHEYNQMMRSIGDANVCMLLFVTDIYLQRYDDYKSQKIKDKPGLVREIELAEKIAESYPDHVVVACMPGLEERCIRGLPGNILKDKQVITLDDMNALHELVHNISAKSLNNPTVHTT